MATPHTAKDFESGHFPTWCPGCGNFGIWTALKQALVELNVEPHRTVLVFGIGCSGNETNFVKAYIFHSLHGRSLPVAEGIALANSGLTTIAIGGDGDGYGEGMAHFIHTIRANPNITYIVHDNQVYSLTKGQSSPTSEHGFKTPSTPFGNPDNPINPISLALTVGAGFVARGFVGDTTQLTALIKAAIRHRGFSLVDVFQPCVTFNATNTFKWFYGKVVKLETLKHDPTNRDAAWKMAQHPDKLPLGVFYQQEKPTLEDGFTVIAKKPLVEQSPERRQIVALLEKMK